MNDRYRVDPALIAEFDAAAFESDVVAARKALKKGAEGATAALERALELFRGDFLDGERVGIVVGFFGGLLIDALLPGAVMGLTALIFTLIGYGVGLLRYLAPPGSVWTPVLPVAGASAVAGLGYATLAIIMGQRWVSLEETVKIAGLVVLYNTLLTPFVFPLIKRVADRFRPERVIRL